MNYSVAICGKKEEILAFKGLGLHVLPIDTAKEAELTILDVKKTEGNRFAIIFVTEDIFQEFSDEALDRIAKDTLPAVVPIPGHMGTTGFGDKRMKKFVEQAVGSDIFGE